MILFMSHEIDMWTHRTVQVGDHDIGLALEVLAHERRAPMAASIAWLAVTSAIEDGTANQAAWETFVRDVIKPHVHFTVLHDDPDALGESWWLEAIRQATMAFVEANGLDGLIKEQLPSFYRQALTSRQTS